MYILSIGDSILQALRTLTLAVCETIYSLICFCFDIFNEMGTATLDIDVNGIFKRVEFILGLFMLFRLTFAGIQYLVDPDAMTDKQKGIGSIIKRVLIVIILLGSTNYLFKEAYILQDRIIESRLIEKIILPGTTPSSSGAGADIAWYTFSQFYTLNTKEKTECNSAYKMLEQQFKDLGSMDAAYLCLNDKMNTKENVSNKQYVVNFNGLIALLCGALLLWMIVVCTVQLGIRIFQLAYLQIVAPIPIMMYLVPKGEENLKKWGKQCLSTFLDFFLRLAILDFVILVSQTLMTNQENLAVHFSTNNVFQEGYVVVILIIALFAFAKKVPNLLKEIFPSTGSTGFDFGLHGKSAKQLGTFAGGAVAGGIGGLVTGIKYGKGTAGGRLGGAITGLARGTLGGAKSKGNIFANASKGMANQRVAMQRAYNRNNDGSDFWGRTLGAGDAARTKAAFDEELSFYDAYTKNADLVDSELAKNANVKAILAEQQALMSRGESGGPIPTAAEIASMDSRVKAVKQTALQNEMNRRGTADENKVLIAALDNAEAMRKKAVKSNYAGFEKYHETSVLDYSDNFLDSVKEVKNETRNIKDPSGSRNEAYKKAEANAKYAKDK